MFPVLTPLAVDPAHPFPFIPNLGFTLALELVRPGDRKTLQALVRLPPKIERFVRLPATAGGAGRERFMLLETLIAMNAQRLFPGYLLRGAGAVPGHPRQRSRSRGRGRGSRAAFRDAR